MLTAAEAVEMELAKIAIPGSSVLVVAVDGATAAEPDVKPKTDIEKTIGTDV